jgi:hypothetical protein
MPRPAFPTPVSAPVAQDHIAAPKPTTDNLGDDEEDGDEDGAMEIGVSTTPIGVEELQLAFADLWARGYAHQGRFVVAAGSEMRRTPNPSANAPTLARRQHLIDTGAAVPIPGAADRYRLQVAVAFPSLAIAAKVLCGAHVASDKWRPLRAARPFIIAA